MINSAFVNAVKSIRATSIKTRIETDRNDILKVEDNVY